MTINPGVYWHFYVISECDYEDLQGWTDRHFSVEDRGRVRDPHSVERWWSRGLITTSDKSLWATVSSTTQTQQETSTMYIKPLGQSCYFSVSEKGEGGT